MNQKRKVLALLLALVMSFGLMAPALAVEVPAAGDSMKGTLVILHVNDSHGRDVAAEGSSIGTAGVLQLKKDYEAAGAEVLLMHAGDATQGTALVNFEQGKKAIEWMNAAGYDVMALGNHEFDWGTENLKTILEGAEFPVLAANAIDTSTNKPLTGDRVILTTESGIKVGVFGLDTPETATKAHPDKVKGVNFVAEDAMFKIAQEQVDALKAEGVDLIVCLGHLGISDESIGNRSIDLIEKVNGIDLFIDGHSHDELGQMQGDTMLVSTGEYLKNVGVVTYKDGKLDCGLLSAKEYSAVDADLSATINAYNEKLDADLEAAVIGKSEVLLDGARAPGVRTQETNLGDFAADSILWYAQQELGTDNVHGAITNGGGIRESIQIGDVNMKHMITVFPFGNTVATVTITGADLLEALEAATWSTPDAIGAFPQVAGITFTIDGSVDYAKGEMYEASTYYAPAAPGSRIKDLTVAGEPVDLEATYVIATNDFTAAGGDTYGVFQGKPLYNTGLSLEDALIDFVAKELNGVISAEQYGEPAGRIKQVNMPKYTTASFNLTGEEWFYAAARYVLADGYMGSISTESKDFGANANVTRATVFEVLYRMEGAPEATGASFADVTADDWFAASAAWAKETGITSGTNVGYEGNKLITRQELAKIFTDYLAFNGVAVTAADISTYADAASVADWATEGMSGAVGAGIVSGKTGNLLDPTANAMRSELAQMLLNMSGSFDTNTNGVVATVSKYGNIELDIAANNLYNAGFVPGDMLAVTINGETYDIPMCTNYSDVDNGALVLRAQKGGPVIIAINMGNFAETYKVAEGDAVAIVLKEAGAYLDEYEIRNLVRTNNREDYSTDAVFANFRVVEQGSIAPGVLYRSSSPINEEIGRASYADTLAKAAGVKTFINLADSEESLAAHYAAETFASPYYKSIDEAGGVIALNMGVDFSADDFKTKLKDGMAFLAEHEGPYLIHCNEGKDRAGFTAALLQALMGASVDEIVADYMRTYINYYGVEIGTAKYVKIAEGNIMESLRSVAGKDSGASLDGVNLVTAATNYLRGIGLTTAQINSIKTNLSTPIDGANAYSAVEVVIENGDRAIPAIVTLPEGKGPFSAVVLAHGHGGSKDENTGFGSLAAALAEQGIASIRMDFPGCGESSEAFTENYLSNMISDTAAAKAYLVANYTIDKAKIGIFGYSMGGRIALEIGTSTAGSEYKAMAMLAPSVDDGKVGAVNLLGGEAAYDALLAEAKANGHAVYTTIYGQVQTLSNQWFLDMADSNPLRYKNKYAGPMMVLYGDKDTVIAESIIENLVATYPDITRVDLTDADHGYGFYSDQPELTAALEKAVTEFFQSNLK